MSKAKLAIAMANYASTWAYIENEKGQVVCVIAEELKRGKKDWAWYARNSDSWEEIGPFKTRYEAAVAAWDRKWIPKSFIAERAKEKS